MTRGADPGAQPRRAALPPIPPAPVLELRADRALQVVWAAAALLVVSGVLVHALTGPTTDADEAEGVRGAARLLALDTESNLPTLFSALLIFCCAAASAWHAAWLSALGDPLAGRWRLVACGFAGLGVDEAVAIHEVVPATLHRALLTGVHVKVIWIGLVAAGLLAAALVAVPVVRSLSRDAQRRWCLAGVLLALAAAVDVVGASPRAWAAGLVGPALLGVEEGLELSAFLLVLGSLLRSLRALRATVRLAPGS